MRRETENGSFDWPCFVQTVYLRTLLTEDYKKYRIYILRQGVPEVCSSKGYASFKQVEPWSWHIEVIPGVSNSGTGRQARFTDCP